MGGIAVSRPDAAGPIWPVWCRTRSTTRALNQRSPPLLPAISPSPRPLPSGERVLLRPASAGASPVNRAYGEACSDPIRVTCPARAACGQCTGRALGPHRRGDEPRRLPGSAGAIRDGAVVRTWVREVFTQEQRSEQVGVYYYSANSLVSYDCTTRTFVPLFRVFYGGDGTELRRINLDAVELPALVPPGSVARGLARSRLRFLPPKGEEASPARLHRSRWPWPRPRPNQPRCRRAPNRSRTCGQGGVEARSRRREAADCREQGDGRSGREAKRSQAAGCGRTQVIQQAARSRALRSGARAGCGQMRRGRSAACHTYLSRLPIGPRAATAAKLPARPPKPRRKTKRRDPLELQRRGAPGKLGRAQGRVRGCANGKREPDRHPRRRHGGARAGQVRLQACALPCSTTAHGAGQPAAGQRIVVGGRRFELQQFHFHSPSEERIDGRQYEMSRTSSTRVPKAAWRW